MKKWKFVLGVTLAALLGAPPVQAEYPEAPLRIIVPTDPGGSVDSLARVFQRKIEEMGVFPSVVVVNLPGAGGTVGTRALRDAEADGYTIGLWTSGLLTSKAMGVVDFDHTAFTILGGTGQTEVGLGVLDSSRFASMEQLIEEAKTAPNSISVATNIGLPVHFTPMAFAKEAGVELKFVQIGGGAKRLASILGGHTDIAMFSVSEFQQFAESGLRPVILFSKARTGSLPDLPTAIDLGYDFVATEPRIWLAPKDIGTAEAAKLSEILASVVADPAIQAELTGQSIEYEWQSPEDVKAQLDDSSSQIEPLGEIARNLAKQ